MKIKNIKAVSFIKNLTKAYTEGIYADTPANRKLGRVGMTYAAYAEKIKGEEKKESNKEDIDFNLIEAERGIYDLYPNPVELKSTSSYVKKISARDSKSGGIEYEVFLEFKNGNKINSETERLNNQSEVKKWIKEKIEKERNKSETEVLVDKTETKEKIALSDISVQGEDKYKFVIGKSPKGRGNWAFKIGNDDINKDPSKIFFVEGMYEEAKNKAKKEAQKRGNIYSITLLY